MRARREAAGYTRDQVANLIEVHERTVRRWELNQAVPRFDDLLRLARLYDTSVADFYAGAS